MKISRTAFLTLLIFFNAIPIYGVFNWEWSSFDIIFLYWCENIIIGFFMILRIVVRPYHHKVELSLPLFMAPFFTIHYGMFCYGHGTFLFSLFGAEALGELAKMPIPDVILPVIESRQLFWPLAALFSYQLLDWVRDTLERGLGSDSIKDLTTAPYKRIVVLHITILASGFALASLDHPTIGLLLLILFKTAFDIYHWNKDEKKSDQQKTLVLNDAAKKKIDDLIENPKITINGKTTHFDSFKDLQASKYYGLMKGLLSVTGGKNGLKRAEEYIEARIKEKQERY